MFKSLETYKMSDLDFYKTGLPGIGNLDKPSTIINLKFHLSLDPKAPDVIHFVSSPTDL